MSVHPEFAAAFAELHARAVAAQADNPSAANLSRLETGRAALAQVSRNVQAVQRADLPPRKLYFLSTLALGPVLSHTIAL